MPVVQRHHQPHPFHHPVCHLRILLQVRAVPGEHKIVFAAQKARCQNIRSAPVEADENIGIVTVKPLDPHGQIAALVAADIAHLQAAGHSDGGIVYQVHRPGHAVQNGSGFQQKSLSGAGQADRAGTPVEELAAQGLLQQPNLLGDGCLGNKVALRRPGKAALFCGRGQCFQFFTVHGNISLFAGYHRFYHEAVANATT